jgi:hypothetical protein
LRLAIQAYNLWSWKSVCHFTWQFYSRLNI